MRLKSSTLLFVGSLVINATLLTLFFPGAVRKRLKEPVATAHNFGLGNPISPATASRLDADTWTRLNPSKLDGLFERLRAAGFSAPVARALVAAQVHAQFAPRRAAINAGIADRPFWEPADPDSTAAAALRQITREENQAIRNLLGPEAIFDETQTAILRNQFPDFSEAKIKAIQRAQHQVKDLVQELQITTGAAPPEMVALTKQGEADINELLTPEERVEYDLRMGSIATNLRQRLAGFDPSEQEFLTIYRIHRAYEEATKRPGGSADLERPFSDADKQLVSEIKAALGEARYAEYLRSNSASYQTTLRLVARLEMPVETANQVYAVQKETQQRLFAVESDRALASAERNAQVAALTAEAQSKIGTILGSSGLAAYRQYGGGWMNPRQLQRFERAPVPR